MRDYLKHFHRQVKYQKFKKHHILIHDLSRMRVGKRHLVPHFIMSTTLHFTFYTLYNVITHIYRSFLNFWCNHCGDRILSYEIIRMWRQIVFIKRWVFLTSLQGTHGREWRHHSQVVSKLKIWNLTQYRKCVISLEPVRLFSYFKKQIISRDL